MRKPITKIEKELVRNFEHIVVDEVNKLDPIGLLAMDCPNDEYKSEIRDITLRLSRPMNWLELPAIARTVAFFNRTHYSQVFREIKNCVNFACFTACLIP